jgi:hypothetical protein
MLLTGQHLICAGVKETGSPPAMALSFITGMKTQFYILLSLKTPRGFVDYGQYFFGDDRGTAYELFGQLKGHQNLKDSCLLHIYLMETVDELPVKVKTICCTLDELAYNCKLIAREVFRLKNVEEME